MEAEASRADAAVDLSVDLAGLKLRNPTILASGILGTSVEILKRIYREGAGAVVSKSVGVSPRKGYLSPTVVEVPGGYLNAIGLSNPGAQQLAQELDKAEIGDAQIIASVIAASPEEAARVVEVLDKTAVVAFELNLSCPHVEGVAEVCQNPSLTGAVVEAAKGKTRKPVFAKVSAGVADVVEIARAAEGAGADAITAINTLRAMAIDAETGRPILANKFGGLSGPALKPIALRCVYEIARGVGIPVVGSGGVSSWEDAVEFLLAGATAVQLGTVLARGDLSVFRQTVEGIKAYLRRKGFGGVSEIVGLSHRY